MSSALERMIAESKQKEAASKARRDAVDKVFKDAAADAAAKDAAEKAGQQERLDADRAAREAKFEQELEQAARGLFFAANSGASEALYQSVRDEYRKKVLSQRAEQATQGEVTGLYRKFWR
ncbi:MAG TPA: hypothetical protein VEX70_15910 [Pyrinomonadaceae bacterium]|nr:hypothetical protein [Pyrinomonadaceae bacterium]